MPHIYFEISTESAGATMNSESSGCSKSLETHLKSPLDCISSDNFNVHNFLGELCPKGLFSCPMCNKFTMLDKNWFRRHLYDKLALKK